MNPYNRQPRVPPLLVIGFGILAVSTASIFIRYAQIYAPSLVIAAYRLAIATLVLAPVAFFRHRSELHLRKRWEIVLALLSGLCLALHFAAWITSLEYTTVTSSVVLVATTPLWVALLSPITLKEPLTRVIWIGMVLVIVGSVIVGLSDTCTLNAGTLSCPTFQDLVTGEAFLGDMLALVGAWMAAGSVLIGRKLRSQMSLVPYISCLRGGSSNSDHHYAGSRLFPLGISTSNIFVACVISHHPSTSRTFLIQLGTGIPPSCFCCDHIDG